MRHAAPQPGREPIDGLDALDTALARAAADADNADDRQRKRRTDYRWRTRGAAALLALSVAAVAAVAAYAGARYAYQRAEEHTDARIAVLENDLAQRRAASVAANAGRDQQIAELRAVVCVTLDHLTPRDGQVQALRSRFLCTGGPYPQPTGTPPR